MELKENTKYKIIKGPNKDKVGIIKSHNRGWYLIEGASKNVRKSDLEEVLEEEEKEEKEEGYKEQSSKFSYSLKSEFSIELGIIIIRQQVCPDISLKKEAKEYIIDLMNKFCNRIALEFFRSEDKTFESFKSIINSFLETEKNKEVAQYAEKIGTDALEKFRSNESNNELERLVSPKVFSFLKYSVFSGLKLPVHEVKRFLYFIDASHPDLNRSINESIYLTAVLEYFIAEIIECGFNIAKENGYKHIHRKFFEEGFGSDPTDEELAEIVSKF